MIHHFKNYVLRSDAIYGQQAAQDIESLRATLAAYRQLGMNTGQSNVPSAISPMSFSPIVTA